MERSSGIERRVEFYSPESEVEVLLLKSIFDAAGIEYFVKNDTFGSMAIGPQIAHCNRKTFFVAEHRLAEARELVGEFLQRTEPPRPRPYRLRDKLRMVFEVLFFGWFLPGGRRGHGEPDLRLIPGAAVGADDARATQPREGRGQRCRRGPPLRLIHPAREGSDAPSEPSSTSGSERRTPER